MPVFKCVCVCVGQASVCMCECVCVSLLLSMYFHIQNIARSTNFIIEGFEIDTREYIEV